MSVRANGSPGATEAVLFFLGDGVRLAWLRRASRPSLKAPAALSGTSMAGTMALGPTGLRTGGAWKPGPAGRAWPNPSASDVGMYDSVAKDEDRAGRKSSCDVTEAPRWRPSATGAAKFILELEALSGVNGRALSGKGLRGIATETLRSLVLLISALWNGVGATNTLLGSSRWT